MEKITMIGVSGSGKTCFIYAMHNYMSIAQNGFIFTAKDPDVDLELGEGWSQIAYDGTWPPGTMITHEYDFYVQYANTKIMEFSWCDYRGGVLSERSGDKDVELFLKRINESSCFVISIGADTMKELIENNSNKERELYRINGIINRFTAENNRRIPIVIALTKADMYTREEQGKLLPIIKRYFNALFFKDAGWLVAIVPIQLGINLGTEYGGDSISGVISPRNIQIPVLFFVSSVLKEKLTGLMNQLNNIRNRRSDYRVEVNREENKGWWNKLWNGDKSPELHNNISNLNEDEQAILRRIPEIEKILEAMSEQFKVCKMYFKGEEI